ncbi:glutamyl-tRNA amidotransferase [Actinosynnema sp. ALI-1.44]|uniref:GatB/YqeY domain-containing protein n=1 Tax=Actinosynnema sp. ALI-1.44 TaxID=1933779 RepID=UPI00097C4785|nr:GatB/YqeY domain-containing protein [Actinosynnema sp. ALI-1.44]ONI78940.1 glutamyl-tRNA amidotransferase [Actinosynnema sp. ALI-1.44]
MAELKDKLKSDMVVALKAKDTARLGTLRMVLAAVSTEEVAGKEARELTDEEVQRVLTREAKKRKEAAEAFESAGRAEQASAERAEAEVIAEYLPAQLSDDELADLVGQAAAEVSEQVGGELTPKQMGLVMKAANAKVAGRAEGGRVAAAVKAKLAG